METWETCITNWIKFGVDLFYFKTSSIENFIIY